MESDKNNQNINSIENKENLNSLIFKIVILGDSGVGKTSILHYYVFNKCKNFIKKLKRTQSIQLL